MIPAASKALAYLYSAIRAARERQQATLPPHRTLAAQVGVAPATMLKAIAHCRTKGILRTSKHGISILSAPPAQSATPLTSPRQRWRKVHDHLRARIAHGDFTPGSLLPTPKELSHRYGVSYRTLKKALDTLTASGIIEPYRRTYRVLSAVSEKLHQAASLVVMMQGEPYLVPTTVSPRTIPQLRLLEEHCARRGLRLELLNWTYLGARLEGNDALRNRLTSVAAERPVAGCMLWTTAIAPAAALNAARIATEAGVPVAILDEEGTIDISKMPGSTHLVGYFRLSHGHESGQRVARYLWELGHRSIAFIDIERESDFGATRFAGMQTELQQLGKARVHHFGLLPSQPRRKADMAWFKQLRSQLLTEDTRAHPHHHPISDRLTDKLILQIMDTLERQSIRQQLWQRLGPLLEQDFTAWVGCNDLVALECLDYLEAKGINVPAGKAVIGFDDSLEAMMRQMSSYNFNAAALIRAGVDYVLGMRDNLPHPPHGYIVQRRSTMSPLGNKSE